MSRVEPNQNPSERRGSEQLREAERGRHSQTPDISYTPSKAEGEERDIEEALRNEDRRT